MHVKSEEMGRLKRNQIVGNVLFDLYVKCGVLEKVHELFDMLPIRKIVSCNVIIIGYARDGQAEEKSGCWQCIA